MGVRRLSVRDVDRTYWCRLCGASHTQCTSVDLPGACPACREPAFWTTEPMPRVPYVLEANDRRFLKAIRIDPDA